MLDKDSIVYAETTPAGEAFAMEPLISSLGRRRHGACAAPAHVMHGLRMVYFINFIA